MSTQRNTTKTKLYIVLFKDGYKKPVMAETADDARKEAISDKKHTLANIESVTVEQNYYPNHFYVGDV